MNQKIFSSRFPKIDKRTLRPGTITSGERNLLEMEEQNWKKKRKKKGGRTRK